MVASGQIFSPSLRALGERVLPAHDQGRLYQTVAGSARTPLFLVGCYRSGTTLLYALLNQHPTIALLYECDALAVPGVAPVANRWLRWQERSELWNRVFSRHRMAAEEIGTVRELRDLYLAFAERGGASFYGEKSPAYTRWLPKVTANFPQARFIIVLREMPEIYQSICDAGRQGSRFFSRRGQLPRLLWSHRVMLRDVQRLAARSVPIHFVRYREAVTDPKEVTKRICAFLGIEFEEAMGSLLGADLSAIYDAPHHERVRSRRILRRLEGRAEISPQREQDLRAFGQTSGQAPFLPSEEMPPLRATQRLRYHAWLVFGAILCGLDDLKRLLYEYLPAAWFVAYRRLREARTQSNDSARDIGSTALTDRH